MLGISEAIKNYAKRAKQDLAAKQTGRDLIRKTFAEFHGSVPDTTNPIMFYEKMFVRMDSTIKRGSRMMTRLADKLAVRDYVRKTAGDHYLVPLLWSGPDPRDIPFDALPEKYIIKTNHGCGGHIIGNERLDREATITALNEMMRSNYYWNYGEYQYYKIKPHILVEEFLESGSSGSPLDYRCWCFGGKPEFVQVDDNLHSINPFFDRDWNLLPFNYREKIRHVEIPRPERLSDILELASMLAAEIDFVRVDIYNIRDKVYFGEMTFMPVAGLMRFSPPEWNEKIGNLWQMKHSGVVRKSDTVISPLRRALSQRPALLMGEHRA